MTAHGWAIAGVGALCLWWLMRKPTREPKACTPIASLTDGMIVRVRGRVRALGELSVAPVSGLPSAYWQATIQCGTDIMQIGLEGGGAFAVVDGSGALPIDVWGLGLTIHTRAGQGNAEQLPPGLRALLDERQEKLPWLQPGQPIRWHERRVAAGELVDVEGHVHEEMVAGTKQLRMGTVDERMSAWVFDLDGDRTV